MAGERIPALAGYLVLNAVPHLAQVVETALQEPGQDLEVLLDRAIENASAKLCGTTLASILGSRDAMAEEAFLSASQLCTDALLEAMGDPRVWDRRRTAKTCGALLSQLAGGTLADGCGTAEWM